MSFRKLLALAIVQVLLFFSWRADAACLNYTSRVDLTGTLEQATFPGPPHYSDIHLGDKPLAIWFIELPKPVCIDVDTQKPDLNMAEKSISMFEVVVGQNQYNEYSNLIGQQIHISGTLFSAIGSHHHTPVVVDNVQFEPK